MARKYVRKFDWEEAQRAHANGESLSSIARRVGVSPTAVLYAVDREARERQAQASREWRKGTCVKCGATVNRHSAYKKDRPASGLCRTCAQTRNVVDGLLRCVSCRSWKPDSQFSHDARETARRGRRGICSVCDSRKRQDRRWKNRVPCAECGEPCTPRQKWDRKPPRCRRCAYGRRAWTREEEERVIAHDIPDRELAIALGRTVLSIQVKRSRLIHGR